MERGQANSASRPGSNQQAIGLRRWLGCVCSCFTGPSITDEHQVGGDTNDRVNMGDVCTVSGETSAMLAIRAREFQKLNVANPSSSFTSSSSRFHSSYQLHDEDPRYSLSNSETLNSISGHNLYDQREWKWSDFEILECLHKGYAASVFQAYCTVTQKLVALKVYQSRLLDQASFRQVQREVAIHRRLKHKNVIKLHTVFEDNGKTVLVMEFAEGGDLYAVLHKHGGRLSEHRTVERVLTPLLQVLDYLHAQGILHRDIKPENVLFTRQGTLKLADFGLAIDLRVETPTSRVGTRGFMAPEVLRCKNKPMSRLAYGLSADCWSIGALAYQVVTGLPPCRLTPEAIEAHFVQDKPYTSSAHNLDLGLPHISELANEFISSALVTDRNRRASVEELLQHPWISAFQARPSFQGTSSRRLQIGRRSAVSFSSV